MKSHRKIYTWIVLSFLFATLAGMLLVITSALPDYAGASINSPSLTNMIAGGNSTAASGSGPTPG